MNHHDHSSSPISTTSQGIDGQFNDAGRMLFGLQKATTILLRRRRWLIAGPLLGMLAGVFLTISMKPMFQGTATIELNKGSDGSLSLNLGDLMNQQMDVAGEALQTDLQTETAILKSDSLALEVIRRLNLASQPPFAPKDQKMEVEKGIPLADAPITRSRVLAIFAKNLNVDPVHGTRLILVRYQSHDPKQAALVANAMVDSYKSQYLESHYKATSEASDWLTKQLSDLKANVESSERKLTDFERQSGILTIQGMGNSESPNGTQIHSPVIERLDQLNTEVTAAEANRIEKEAIYRLALAGDEEAVVGLGSDPVALSTNSAVLNQGGGISALQLLKQKQNELKLQLASDANTLGPRNGHIKELNTKIQQMDLQIHHEMLDIVKRSGADLKLAKDAESAVRRQFDKQEEDANKLNEKAVELAILSQEASSRKKLYEDLYTRLQEANVSAGIKATNITVVDPARSQAVPIRPKPTSNVVLGLIFGLLSGLGMAGIAEGLDSKVIDMLEVEQITGMPVIGFIPKFEQKGSAYGEDRRLKSPNDLTLPQNGTMPPIWLLCHPQSIASEAFRSLRTSILLSRSGGQLKVLVITSCIPGEGKSTLSLNLGLTFAQNGKRVIMVEADMRRPTMNRMLRLNASAGLSSVLCGASSLDDSIIRSVGGTTLDVLPAGPQPPLPSELLGSAAFDTLINDLRGMYDMVLLDSPPALLISDAMLISARSDAAIWVVQAGAISRQYLYRTTVLVERNAVPLIGFVMNKANRSFDPYGYSGGYYKENLYGHYFRETKSNDA